MDAGTSVASSRRRWKDEQLVLFVEGFSDLRFYAEMMEHLGLHQNCFIQDLGGKGRGKLQEEAALLLTPVRLASIQSVAVLFDADDNAESSFHLARQALRDAAGVDVARPGEWVQGNVGPTRFGIFIAGGKDDLVEIESLAWAAWRARDENAGFRKCVDQFVECAGSCGRKLQSIDKVRIGAVLSVMNEDDPRLGPGAQARVFDFDAPEFSELRDFLRGMDQDSLRSSES